MSLLKRVLLAAGMSWIYSATLGLLFAACASGRLSFSTLRLPGVVPVALITSTIIALALTPIAAWSVRTGTRNLCLYGPILWIVLAVWLVTVVPRNAAFGESSVLVLALVGLVFLGFIPARK
jgi:hypothetical protein